MNKKTLVLSLATSLLLVGCGNANTVKNPQDDNNPTTGIEQQSTTFDKFFSGEISATLNDNLAKYLEANNEISYSGTIDEITNAYAEEFGKENIKISKSLKKLSNGLEVMVTSITNEDVNNSSNISLYLLLCAQNDGIEICYVGTTGYRTETTLYDNGVIEVGGSSSAASLGYNYYYIDANGNFSEFYKYESSFLVASDDSGAYGSIKYYTIDGKKYYAISYDADATIPENTKDIEKDVIEANNYTYNDAALILESEAETLLEKQAESLGFVYPFI